MYNQTKKHVEASKEILEGVNEVADAVKVTLGAGGRNVIIDSKNKQHHVTKDGVTVAHSIHPEESLPALGAKIIQEAAGNTADDAGDGTSTSTVLAQAIYTSGLKVRNEEGLNPIDIKKGIDKAVDTVVSFIKEQAVVVKGDIEKIKNVATISTNGDSELGDKIAEVMDKIGDEGLITVEESQGFETTFSVLEGAKVSSGYASRGFVTDNSKDKSIYRDAKVILIDDEVSSVQDYLKILEVHDQMGDNKPLLFFCSSIHGEALETMVLNKIRNGWKICAVSVHGLGEEKSEILKDISAVTGAAVLSPSGESKVNEFTPEMFGFISKFESDSTSTILVSNQEVMPNVARRADEIRSLLHKERELNKNPLKIAQLEGRLAKINGGVAVMYVGGATETEMKERKDRVDDAIGATKSAIQEGIVPGGGVTLYGAISALSSLDLDNEAQNAGVSIVMDSLLSPIKNILINGGLDASEIINEIENKPFGYGYDVRNNKFVNMIDSGIIDPAKVSRVAIQNAASVAGTLLTTEIVIYDKE